MDRKRRQIMKSIAGAAAGLAGARLIGNPVVLRGRNAVPSVYSAIRTGNPLRIPETFSGDEIVAGVSTQTIWPGHETTVWTFGGTYPAPTIRVRSGERFSVRLRNQLEEETTIHWHGQVIPHEMDGHPMNAVGPGETFDYSFDVLNRAGTYFYHPHPHGRTAPQNYKGMAGFFIVTDDEEESLDLPGGELDLPLLVQDRKTNEEYEFTYEPTPTERLNGILGDAILVNGTPDPFLEVSRDRYRLRILNGSNARLLKLGFLSGKTFHVIGTDGGLLDRPYEAGTLFLGPAERVELLIDFSTEEIGSSLQLMTLNFGGATTYRQQGFEMPILRFDVVAPGAGSPAIPSALLPFVGIDPAEAARTRVWELQTTPVPRDGNFHHINGRLFDMERIDAGVRLGETEIWEIRNTHSMPHPVHIHGVQFQILERIDGQPIEPRDLGWKDTVTIWGYETVRVIMRFTPYPGIYLIHCHNLEHEDGGMMLNYEIGDTLMGVESRPGNAPDRFDLR